MAGSLQNQNEPELEDRIRGVIYGNAIGDAIGLLTEFMAKEQAEKTYNHLAELEYKDKIADSHRRRFAEGDWTDDTDQMILIMISLVHNQGKVSITDYAQRLINWARCGFSELGDAAGMGLGATTSHVLHHEKYLTDPHFASKDIWEESGKVVAPNGALMRTSILGVFQYTDMKKVQRNTLDICKVTHHDPRCQASTVAMTTAIALMLRRSPNHLNKDGSYNVDVIIQDAYKNAKGLIKNKSHRKELKKYMFADDISLLELDEKHSIGYTFKCLGAGFWAFKQEDFRVALTAITMEGGDADTNGAVAGALLGCKLGTHALPPTWLNNLKHKQWLDDKIDSFLPLAIPSYKKHSTVEKMEE